MRLRHGLVIFGVLLGLAGCAGQKPPPPPLPPPVVLPDLRSHLLGTWELPARKGRSAIQIAFTSDGQLTFKGGFEFFNPGLWSLDEAAKELRLTFPQATDEKLDIFRVSRGEGLKNFDRKQKQVVYDFDMETGQLNVGGWMFSKEQATPEGLPAEPVLH